MSPEGVDPGRGEALEAREFLMQLVAELRETAELHRQVSRASGGPAPASIRRVLDWERARAHGGLAALEFLGLVTGQDTEYWRALIDAAGRAGG